MKKELHKCILCLLLALLLIVSTGNGVGFVLAKYVDTFDAGIINLTVKKKVDLEPLELWLTERIIGDGGPSMGGMAYIYDYSLWTDGYDQTPLKDGVNLDSATGLQNVLNACGESGRDIIVHTTGIHLSMQTFNLNFTGSGNLTLKLDPGLTGPVIKIITSDQANQMKLNLSNLTVQGTGTASENPLFYADQVVDIKFSDVLFRDSNYTGEYGSAITIMAHDSDLDSYNADISGARFENCTGGIGPVYIPGIEYDEVTLVEYLDNTIEISHDKLYRNQNALIKINAKDGYSLPNTVLLRRTFEQTDLKVVLDAAPDSNGITYKKINNTEGELSIPSEYMTTEEMAITAWQFYELDVYSYDNTNLTPGIPSQHNDYANNSITLKATYSGTLPETFTVGVGPNMEKKYTINSSGENNPAGFVLVNNNNGTGTLTITGSTTSIFTNPIVHINWVNQTINSSNAKSATYRLKPQATLIDNYFYSNATSPDGTIQEKYMDYVLDMMPSDFTLSEWDSQLTAHAAKDGDEFYGWRIYYGNGSEIRTHDQLKGFLAPLYAENPSLHLLLRPLYKVR